MKKVYNLNNAKGGAAVTLVCKRHKSKIGWGKINEDGNIEFFIPEDADDKKRDGLIIDHFSEKLEVKKSSVEIFSGSSDRMIVTMLNITSEKVDQLLFSLK